MAQGYFWGNDPNVNATLRERIALSMMGKSRAVPKTIGEGLYSVGEAIGDIGVTRSLLEQDRARNEANAATVARIMGIGDTPTAAAPTAAPAAAAATPAGASPTGEYAAGNPVYPEDDNTPSPLDPPSGKDRDLAIRTIAAEARNQPPEGQTAVASVIRNRAVNGGYGGNTAGGVVTAPNQFEPWNTQQGRTQMASLDPNGAVYKTAATALDNAYAGNDPTNGAVQFFAPKAQAALGRPAPAWGRGPGQDIGDHRFFGGASPQQQAALPPQPQAITQAPRAPQQIAQLPQPTRTDADPGYVMPENVAPQRPADVPMHPREQAARLEYLRSQNDPGMQKSMLAIIEQEKAKRELQQQQLNEDYKQKLHMHQALELKRQEQIETQAKRVLDAKKLQQEIDAGRTPTLKSIDGTDYQYDPETKSFREPKIEGARSDDRPRVNMNQSQSEAYKFGTIMREAGRNVGDAAVLTNRTDAAKYSVPIWGKGWVSKAYAEAADHAQRWVMAKLRDESGATIGTTEYNKEMAAYFPAPGDGPKQIADKARARALYEQGQIDSSGPGRKLFEYEDRKRTEAEATPGMTQKNPLVVRSEAEANTLPKGTYGVLNGRPFRVK